jgi:hypothetical protein
MLKHSILPLAGIVLALAGVTPVLAAEPAASETIAAATLHWTPIASAPAPVATSAGAGPGEAADQSGDKALDEMSGRGATTENVAAAMTEQSLSAVNTGNTINATSLVSGAINLQDSALSGFSGIGNILMNTGANNNLQSTMSITVVITQ